MAATFAVSLALIFGLLAAEAAAQSRSLERAAPVRSFGELSRALTACWVQPPGTHGFEITLRFGLTAKGTLRGKPLATYSVLPGSPDRQRDFVAAAILALHQCTPVEMSEDFARVAASRVLNVRFGSAQRPGFAI